MPDSSDRKSTSDGGWSIAMPSNLSGLKEGLNGLGSWLERHRIEMETENRARLVFEEIVTNIIRHGFADSGEHVIHAGAQIDKDDLTLHFVDDGRPFDPRTAPAPAPQHSLAQASIGGRGLMLVRAAARRIDYEHSNGRNRLTVTLPRQ